MLQQNYHTAFSFSRHWRISVWFTCRNERELIVFTSLNKGSILIVTKYSNLKLQYLMGSRLTSMQRALERDHDVYLQLNWITSQRLRVSILPFYLPLPILLYNNGKAEKWSYFLVKDWLYLNSKCVCPRFDCRYGSIQVS